MKKKDLEKRLRELGWTFLRHGGSHDIWHNGKGEQEQVPRHNEVNERLAKAILKVAKSTPGENK